MGFDYSKLKGKIKEIYNTQNNFAEAIGIGKSLLSQKLNNHSEFSQAEMYKICEVLNIKLNKINEYFFTILVKKTKQK